MSNQSYKKPLHARLRPILVLGIPWVLGVGVLTAVQTAQSGSWLARELLGLWSESAQRHHERDALQPLEAHFLGDHVATLAPVNEYEWAAEFPEAGAPAPLAISEQVRSSEALARSAIAAQQLEDRAAHLAAAERAGIEAATQAFVFAQRGRDALSPRAVRELQNLEQELSVQTGRRIRLVPGNVPDNKNCATGTVITIDG